MKTSLLKILGLASVIALSACAKNEEIPKSIVYSVVCDECNITYENKDGATETKTGVKTGWSYTFAGKTNQYVAVTASNIATSVGTIYVNINVNGSSFKSDSKSGALAVVSVNGNVE